MIINVKLLTIISLNVCTILSYIYGIYSETFVYSIEYLKKYKSKLSLNHRNNHSKIDIDNLSKLNKLMIRKRKVQKNHIGFFLRWNNTSGKIQSN